MLKGYFKQKNTVIFLLALFFGSCGIYEFESDRTGGIIVSNTFNWEITRLKKISVGVDIYESCKIELYNGNPLKKASLIAAGNAHKDLNFNIIYNVPVIMDTIVAKCYWPSGKVSFMDIVINESENAGCNFISWKALDVVHGLEVRVDGDGDNIPDGFDQFPNDIDKAFSSFYPSKDIWGTLAFEDLWPSMSQWESDYNDLVTYYQFENVTNQNNQVVKIIGRFTFPAVGALYKNGFGIQLDDVNLWDIKSVSGTIYDEDRGAYFFDEKGLELNQSKPVIIVTNNIDSSLHYTGESLMINTRIGGQAGFSDTIVVSIDLDTPLNVESLGAAPFNPFLIRNGARPNEIHLPNHIPTDLAKKENFGINTDGSIPEEGRYYLTIYNVPWVFHFPMRWKWPTENDDITHAYPNYEVWAESDGLECKDWYLEPDSTYNWPW